MPATLNPIRKALLKKRIIANKGNIKKSMLEAGYAPSTAHRTSGNASVKIIQAEIAQDIKDKVTIDSVLKGLYEIRTAAYNDKDYSTATRCEELLGKYLAMFTERREEVVLRPEDKAEMRPRLAELLEKIQATN